MLVASKYAPKSIPKKLTPVIFKTLFPPITTSSKAESSQETLLKVVAAVYASLKIDITLLASLKFGGVAGASVGPDAGAGISEPWAAVRSSK